MLLEKIVGSVSKDFDYKHIKFYYMYESLIVCKVGLNCYNMYIKARRNSIMFIVKQHYRDRVRNYELLLKQTNDEGVNNEILPFIKRIILL
jgi:hypothetical protein